MDPLSLPFDQYQRYRLVHDLVGPWLEGRAESSPARILDVGGFARNLSGEPYMPLALFLPEEQVWAYDLQEWDHPRYTRIDPDPAGFPADRFDVVVACDVLEHVPAGARPALLGKVLDAAEHAAIVIGPLESDLTSRCESLANLLHRELLGEEDPWLAEHEVNGLPSAETLFGVLEGRALPFEVVHSGHIHRWLLMMIARIYLKTLPDFERLLGEVNRLYNRFFYDADLRPPGYRQAVVAACGEAGRPLLEAARGIARGPEQAAAGERAGWEALHLMATGLLLAARSPEEQLVDGRWESTSLAGPIWGPNGLEFEVVCPEDRLCRVDLFLATYTRRVPGRLEIVVERLEDGEKREVRLPGPSIHDNHWHPVRFPRFLDSAACRFRIRVDAPELTEDAPVALYADDSGNPSRRLYCDTGKSAASQALEAALDRELTTRRELDRIQTEQRRLQQELARERGAKAGISASMEVLTRRLGDKADETGRLRQMLIEIASAAAGRDDGA